MCPFDIEVGYELFPTSNSCAPKICLSKSAFICRHRITGAYRGGVVGCDRPPFFERSSHVPFLYLPLLRIFPEMCFYTNLFMRVSLEIYFSSYYFSIIKYFYIIYSIVFFKADSLLYMLSRFMNFSSKGAFFNAFFLKCALLCLFP